ncbi:MAG: hypothetical protein H0Z29_03050 [Candidatus Marinimicrobia bacterium]|nr:hypothetical protein [Candidatus Neomarinimicrobiota bacterium]
MGVMSIRIKDKNKKLLKIIASYEGKTIGGFIEELLEDYIEKNKDRLHFLTPQVETFDVTGLSAQAFLDWDNKEDEIYDKL